MATKVHSAPVPAMGEITRFLETMREGDPGAMGELLSHVDRERCTTAACLPANQPLCLEHREIHTRVPFWVIAAGPKAVRLTFGHLAEGNCP